MRSPMPCVRAYTVSCYHAVLLPQLLRDQACGILRVPVKRGHVEFAISIQP